MVVLLGRCSAIYGTLVGRVQSDVKTALAFASLTQVGIITAEIGLGLRIYRADSHHRPCLPANAATRAGPDALARLPHAGKRDRRSFARRAERLGADDSGAGANRRIYRLSLERGYLDAIIDEYIMRPFVRLFRWCDAMERRWTDLLSRHQSRESRPRAGGDSGTGEETTWHDEV